MTDKQRRDEPENYQAHIPPESSEIVDPESELARVQSLPSSACPRRYCFFWQSQLFDWSVAADEGCKFQKPKPMNWKFADFPCCRCNSTSPVDHFLPRDPNLDDDGIDAKKWIEARDEKNHFLLQKAFLT